MRLSAVLIALVLLAGCAGSKATASSPFAGRWADPETNSIHEITVRNGIPTVIAVTDYESLETQAGREQYEVKQSSFANGSLDWVYFVPSTGYTVHLTASRTETNRIYTSWDNQSPEGERSSGTEVLIRVDDNLRLLEAPESLIDRESDDTGVYEDENPGSFESVQ